jgi:hypothetical protein
MSFTITLMLTKPAAMNSLLIARAIAATSSLVTDNGLSADDLADSE